MSTPVFLKVFVVWLWLALMPPCRSTMLPARANLPLPAARVAAVPCNMPAAVTDMPWPPWMVLPCRVRVSVVVSVVAASAATVATAAVIASFAIGLVLFFQLLGAPEDARSITTGLYEWIATGNWSIELGFMVDQLSILFALLITGVGGLIHVYSLGYMAHDERRRRFFGYLNLFVAAMLTLVLADNYLVLFVGWEGVGLASFVPFAVCAELITPLERSLGFGAVTVAGADAFFGEQSFDEGEIGLAVLETVGADRVVLGQETPVLEGAGEGGIPGEVFVEDAGNDLGDGLVLEDATVAAVPEGGERGFESQDVLRKTAVGAILGGVGDEATEQTGTTVGKQ